MWRRGSAGVVTHESNPFVPWDAKGNAAILPITGSGQQRVALESTPAVGWPTDRTDGAGWGIRPASSLEIGCPGRGSTRDASFMRWAWSPRDGRGNAGVAPHKSTPKCENAGDRNVMRKQRQIRSGNQKKE